MIIQSSLFLIKKDFIYTKNNLWLPSNADCFSSFINQQFKEIIVPINFYQSKKDVFNFVFIARTIERTSPRAFFYFHYNRQSGKLPLQQTKTTHSSGFKIYCYLFSFLLLLQWFASSLLCHLLLFHLVHSSSR